MGDAFTVTISNWEKFNPRKDYKRPWWFALSNRLMEDSDFYSFNDGEFRAWIYILSQASQHLSGTVRIGFSHADRVCNVRPKNLKSAISKLKRIGAITIDETAICTDGVQETNATGQDITGHNRTGHYTTGGVPELVKIWNENRGGLPEVIGCSKSRLGHAKARWKEKPDPEYWSKIVSRIANSPFCCGQGSTQWVADFDFLIKPDTQFKVLEGKYDSREKATGTDIKKLERLIAERKAAQL